MSQFQPQWHLYRHVNPPYGNDNFFSLSHFSCAHLFFNLIAQELPVILLQVTAVEDFQLKIRIMTPMGLETVPVCIKEPGGTVRAATPT